MAKAGKKTYYWDSCSFIAWIDGGKGHPKDVIDGLDAIAKEVTENRATLCTSVVTETEVLEGKLTPDQVTKFQNLFKRRNVIRISVDHRIARKASEVRNYYHQRSIKISTPDAQHLATALIYGVDEFNTLDGNGERKRPNQLLRLNGNVAGEPLHIRVPVATQPSLFAGVVSQTKEVESGGNIEQARAESESVKPRAVEIQGSGSGHTGGATTKGQKEEKSEG